MARNLRSRMRQFLKRNKVDKTGKTLEMAGCTMEEYNAHMHSKLKPGENMEDMSCDHIRGVCWEDLPDVADYRLL